MNFCAFLCSGLKQPLVLKILLFMSVFWSLFNLVLSFIHVGNSASCPPAGCKSDAKTFCSAVANVPLLLTQTSQDTKVSYTCGYSPAVSANRIFCCLVVVVYVCLHVYNLAAKKWLLFKSTAAICYLALTVWWCATLAMDVDAVVKGQKACNDAGTLDPSASAFSCVNPFYAEPLCDSACIINSLLTTAAAWLVKEETEAVVRTAYSSTNSKIAYQNYSSQPSA